MCTEAKKKEWEEPKIVEISPSEYHDYIKDAIKDFEDKLRSKSFKSAATKEVLNDSQMIIRMQNLLIEGLMTSNSIPTVDRGESFQCCGGESPDGETCKCEEDAEEEAINAALEMDDTSEVVIPDEEHFGSLTFKEEFEPDPDREPISMSPNVVDELRCNMCESGTMRHEEVDGTHIYICEECPNISLEFYTIDNINALRKYLDKN